MDESEKFFNRYGDESVRLHFYENTNCVLVEDLYQHFKTRMMKELGLSEKEDDGANRK